MGLVMMHTMTRISFLAILALTLSGCGGSGEAVTDSGSSGTVSPTELCSDAAAVLGIEPVEVASMSGLRPEGVVADGTLCTAVVESGEFVSYFVPLTGRPFVVTGVDDTTGVGIGDDSLPVTHWFEVRPILSCTGPSEAAATIPTVDAVLPLLDGGQCSVGPVIASPDLFVAADVRPVGDGAGWTVTLNLSATAADDVAWTSAVSSCFFADGRCPGGRLAFVFDGLIVTAPKIQVAEFVDTVELVIADEGVARALAEAVSSMTP